MKQSTLVVVITISLVMLLAFQYVANQQQEIKKEISRPSILEGRIPLTESELKDIYLNGWVHGWKMGRTPGTFFQQMKVDSIEFHNMVSKFPKLKADGHF